MARVTRAGLVALLVVGLTMADAHIGAAQDAAQAQQTQKAHAGRRKMCIGIAVMAAGALMVPVTDYNHGQTSDAVPLLGVGLVMGGSVLLFWGAHQRRSNQDPRTGQGSNAREAAPISQSVATNSLDGN